jgi:hypothetical protein
MSGTGAAASILLPSDQPADPHSTQTDDGMSDLDEQHLQHSALQSQPQLPPQPKTKRYIPPKADSNTFATQQAFLESLQPIDLQQVDQDKRKCPICWKQIGEDPDPGYDNSEQPVKLRCNHVFGNKCLSSLFGLSEATRFTLEPLSFLPGKRGHLLGEKLFAYHREHESNFRYDLETFEKMLKDAIESRRMGPQLFGNYWFFVIRDMMRANGPYGDMTGITLMENAIVMEFELPKSNENVSSPPDALMSEYMSPFSFDQTMLGSGQMHPPFEPFPAVYTTPTSSLTPPYQPPPYQPPTQPLSGPEFVQFTATASSSGQVDGGAVKTWQKALADETNLNKLTALTKENADKHEVKTNNLETQNKYAVLKAQEAREAVRKEEARRMLGMYARFYSQYSEPV